MNKFTHFLGVLGVFAVKMEMNRRMQGTEMFWNDADGSDALLQVQAASPSMAMSGYRASAVPKVLSAHSSTQTAQTCVRKKSKADVHPGCFHSVNPQAVFADSTAFPPSRYLASEHVARIHARALCAGRRWGESRMAWS